MIFVTGGTGLIGSHLLFEFAKKGEKVKALKRETSDLDQVRKIFSYYSKNANTLFETIEWVNGDILDYFGLEKILREVDEIYHCAATISFQSKERKRMIANNVEGTENLVNAALENGVKKLCHVSSVAALGRLQNEAPVSEKTNWVPSKKISGYSESKFFSEAEIWRGIEEGLDAVIVNPSIVLGPGNWNSGSSKLFKTIWDGMKFYTKGVTGFVDVKDVVKTMVLLMKEENFKSCKNQRYVLSAENWSYRDLFYQIADELEKPRPQFFASDFLLKLAWRGSAMYSAVSNRPTMITRESVAGSNKINNFDGTKITRCFGFNYSPVSDSIKQTATMFKKDHSG
ncbi:MAG: NAD-dependent epimerase/dehydratase family protein [Prolixibacteraceae bacterium]